MKSRLDRYQIPIFLLVIACAVLLALWRLSYVTLWSDEFRGTLPLIRLPWVDLLMGHYSWDLNPPLYFLALKAWILFIGSDTEIVMRMLSIVMWMSSLVAFFLLGKTLANWEVGIVLVLAIGFHPDFIVYSTQLRMYPLLILLSSLALLSYAQYSFAGVRSWVWLAATGIMLVLAIYTHYFGVLLSLIILMFCLFNLIANKDHRQFPVLGVIILTWLLTIPLGGLILRQFHQIKNVYSLSGNIQGISPAIILPMLSGQMSFKTDISSPNQIISLIAVVCCSIFLFRIHKVAYAIPLLSSIFISLFLVVLISSLKINLAARYLLTIFLIPWIIISLSFIRTNDKSAKLIRIVAIIAITVSCLQGIRDVTNREYGPDWRYVAKILLIEAGVGEQIVIMGWDAAPIGYYLEKPWITSYDLEEQLSSGSPAKSYLIVDSQFSRKFDFIDYSLSIYQNASWRVKIVRFDPTLSSAP